MKKTSIVIITLFLWAIFLVSCTPGPGTEPSTDSEPTATSEEVSNQDEPAATPVEEPLDMDDPLVQDAQGYAEQFNIPLEEAVRRLKVQGQIGDLGARLEQHEADTFAGLWLEHEPQFGVVIAVTEGGEDILAEYVEGQPYEEYVRIETHTFTSAELKEAQQEVVSIMEQLSVGGSSGIDVRENVVTVTVGNPELFREEVQAAGLHLPEPVRVEAIDADNLTDTLHSSVAVYESPQGQTIYFPRQAPSGVGMDALMEGTLILDENGCLRVEAGNEDGQSTLVIWPAESALQVEDDDISVVNSQGEVVARVGQAIRMGGGGGGNTPNIPDFPHDKCPGPYWIASSLQTLEGQAIPDIFVYPFGLEDAGDSGSERVGQFLSQSKPAPGDDVLSGTLTLEEGCLQVDGYTVLWPPDAYPDDEADPLTIVAGSVLEGEVVATVGEEVQLPGTERTQDDYRFFENKVNCPGPYWGVAAVGGTDSE